MTPFGVLIVRVENACARLVEAKDSARRRGIQTEISEVETR
ncbi:hypothetical protein [Yoonia sp. MH D7]